MSYPVFCLTVIWLLSSRSFLRCLKCLNASVGMSEMLLLIICICRASLGIYLVGSEFSPASWHRICKYSRTRKNTKWGEYSSSNEENFIRSEICGSIRLRRMVSSTNWHGNGWMAYSCPIPTATVKTKAPTRNPADIAYNEFSTSISTLAKVKTRIGRNNLTRSRLTSFTYTTLQFHLSWEPGQFMSLVISSFMKEHRQCCRGIYN